ncbi:energy-coupling factor transporter ATPase [Alicyclobacillus sp. ALC3]|uniref:energy-coupling factor transporter ATPase n=1 Tax=Alicyclobacillus sp. ALC3 TaxID=2796143 RepID=UPI002378D45C|nr:energy-coupling factor transporter ATPase [Alicyclobacillus sp. ALC3]WDL98241.1 energy-coupling factor transporter ATPase [Alicyclobacillus sp. ALC3]
MERSLPPQFAERAAPSAVTSDRDAVAHLPVISVRDVSFAYPRRPGDNPGGDGSRTEQTAPASEHVLQHVSLDVHRGEFVAVLGRNGSGKSTLAKLMNGLMRPLAGEVLVQGRITTNRSYLREVRQRVGMVFQNPDNQLVATVVEEEVAFGLENYGVPRDTMLERVTAALQRVGMDTHRRRRPHQLSGGQKQRVAIASVIAMQPDCVIFDEATSMLDVEGRREVMALMRDLHEHGTAVVAITHHMEEALSADRIVVLERGQVVLAGTPRDVFAQVETVRRLGLDVPLTTDLSERLRRTFATARAAQELPADLLSTEEFANAWTAWRPQLPPVSLPEQAGVADPHSDRDQKPETAKPVIVLRDVSHTYMAGTPLAQTALSSVSLAISSGEIVAIVGQTGSGKSTLIQHLNGLLMPQTGSVVVDGMDLSHPKADIKRVRRTVGLVFQNPEDQLFETLIGDEIAYGPFQFGYSLDEVRERVRFAMDWVGLDFAWRDRPVQALSGGEKRKVAIAGVLALRPSVMVLDEPTAGLDPKARDELLTNLVRLRDDYGMTLVIVTHQMEEVARLADRMVVMADGRVALDEPTRAAFADPDRLRGLHLDEPETVALLRAVARTGTRLEPVQLTRADAFAELCRAVTCGKEAMSGADS